jgi:hypothetical protein
MKAFEETISEWEDVLLEVMMLVLAHQGTLDPIRSCCMIRSHSGNVTE